MDLVDIGANLTHVSFTDDRAAVLARAAAVGVNRLIVTGADAASSLDAATLADSIPSRLWSTAGIHPHHATSMDSVAMEALRDLLRRPCVVAVGECGLDYHRNMSPPDVQRAAFHAQLELAAAVGKPVFLHQRDAHADFSAMLREFRGRLAGGVAHCFTGDRMQLEEYLDLDLYIGITGWVCDERRGAALRDAVPAIPHHRLLVETDAPYLLPRDLKPQPKSRRNEPEHLTHVTRSVAQLRCESYADVAASTTRNAVELFGLQPPLQPC